MGVKRVDQTDLIIGLGWEIEIIGDQFLIKRPLYYSSAN